jgi:radical SAM protein with 4Fe4S-binding SPASM domain
MPFDHFQCLIKQLKDGGFKGTVFPYLNNEIALDDRIEQICEYIQRELPESKVDFDSNGEVLDVDVALRLKRSGVDLRINCYGDGIYEKFKDSGIELIRHEELKPYFYNRGGHLDIGEHKYSGFCERPFTQMYIAYTGSAVLCCSDFYHEVVMGDTYKKGLTNIWNSKKYEAYRNNLYMGNRDYKLCNKCNYVSMVKVCADS